MMKLSYVVVGSSDWTTLPLACVAPQGAAAAEPTLALVDEGSARFDDLQFGRE